jgi:hypothetical protein
MRDEANPRFNPKAKTIFNRYKIRSVTYLNRRDLSASSNTINTQKLDTVQSRGFTLIGDGLMKYKSTP